MGNTHARKTITTNLKVWSYEPCLLDASVWSRDVTSEKCIGNNFEAGYNGWVRNDLHITWKDEVTKEYIIVSTLQTKLEDAIREEMDWAADEDMN
ncbi:hypothetical protein ACJMK2_043025 [Sinanodonta woodiana]|uniref:Uncharacterized protein n=1 Tax=Sinanodonta woodiana TaxID=1069815 RepID=A0ABD3VX18_SINWO